MNKSIVSISEITLNPAAMEAAEMLLNHPRNRFCVQFTRKDGSLRTMTFVPKHEYNDVIGVPTTELGRKIVAAKVRRGIATVCEITTGEGGRELIQPRSVNLNTIVSLKMI